MDESVSQRLYTDDDVTRGTYGLWAYRHRTIGHEEMLQQLRPDVVAVLETVLPAYRKRLLNTDLDRMQAILDLHAGWTPASGVYGQPGVCIECEQSCPCPTFLLVLDALNLIDPSTERDDRNSTKD